MFRTAAHLERMSRVEIYLSDAHDDITTFEMRKSGDLEFIKHLDTSYGRGGHDFQVLGYRVSNVLPHKSSVAGTSG